MSITSEAGLQLIEEKNEQGQVEKRYYMQEGYLEGKYQSFHSNGALFQEAFYKRGLLEKESLFFADNGQLLAKTYYEKGRREKESTLYYKNGMLYAKLYYKEGEFEGLQTYYYESGTIKSLIPYKSGLLEGEVQLFWPDGFLKRSCFFKGGLRNGYDRIWNDQHTLIDEGYYEEGNIKGRQVLYYGSGIPKEEYFYYDAKRHDKKKWDVQGKLLLEIIWDNTNQSFTETHYNEEGSVKKVRTGFWENGKSVYAAK